MILVVHPGSRILIFYPSRIPDPVVKKAPDPGSGSATPQNIQCGESVSFFYLDPVLCLYFPHTENVTIFLMLHFTLKNCNDSPQSTDLN
jgi:hypothetical protein